MLKSFRYLLFPFAFLHRWVVHFRNFLFDKKILRSSQFNFPVICVGNIALGGTGKTPMTEWLIQMLKDRYQIATLSRGYKRRTSGFAIASKGVTPLDIGDEPMQFYHKFPGITVAVGEERVVAIPQILYQKPDTEVIILDDAFQHRAVKAGLNIILTEFQNLYTRDFLFPTGDLRDNRSSMKRADIIVVTKCPSDLSEIEKNAIYKELAPQLHQTVFFTCIEYGIPYHLFNGDKRHLLQTDQVLLVCGIANPEPLKKYLTEHVSFFEMMRFKDHHIFSSSDLEEIIRHYNNITASGKIVLTTEKDAVRLHKFKPRIELLPFYVLPVNHKFLFNEETLFRSIVLDYIDSFKRIKTEL